MSENVTCTFVHKGKLICGNETFVEEEAPLTPQAMWFWIYLGIYVFLVICAGLMSGLTMGLLSLDKTQIEILQKAGRPKEKKYATKLLPIVKRHHLLLTTLLLANACAVEAMPIFMDKITNPLVAILVSVTAVLIFGEIVPQALCTRYGLAIGYYLSPLVQFLMIILFIVAWPISKLLDCLLGSNHATFFRRAELKELVNIHQQDNEDNEEQLTIDEALIIQGALDLKNKIAKDAMVPLDAVFMLSVEDKFDLKTMDRITEAGHSRIPVYRTTKDNVVGVVIVKTIITFNPDDSTPVLKAMRPVKSLLQFYEDEPLYNILNACQTGKSHICLVKRLIEGEDINIGIITLEDIIEEILQEEIVDETDQYIDVAKRVKVVRMMKKISQSRNLNSSTTTGQRSLNSGNDLAVPTDLDERSPLITVDNDDIP